MDTRQQILRAVYQSICEHGYFSTNINEVVRSLGLTKGAFYYYFKDGKQEVGMAVLNEIITPQYLKRWEKVCAKKKNPLKVLLLELEKELASIEAGSSWVSDPLSQLLREFAGRTHPFQERLLFILNNLHESLTVGLKQGISKGYVNPKTKCRQEAWYFLSSLQGAYLLGNMSPDNEATIRAIKGLIRHLKDLAT